MFYFRNLNKVQLISLYDTGELSPRENQGKISNLSGFQQRAESQMYFFVDKKVHYFGSRARAIVVLKKEALQKYKISETRDFILCHGGLCSPFPEKIKHSEECLINAPYGINISDLDVIVLTSGEKIMKNLGIEIPKRPNFVPEKNQIVGQSSTCMLDDCPHFFNGNCGGSNPNCVDTDYGIQKI